VSGEIGPLLFASQAAAKIACFSYIEGFYNPVRLHSTLGATRSLVGRRIIPLAEDAEIEQYIP
jgi:hypothetical protein